MGVIETPPPAPAGESSFRSLSLLLLKLKSQTPKEVDGVTNTNLTPNLITQHKLLIAIIERKLSE